MNSLRTRWFAVIISIGFITTPAIIFFLDILIGNINPLKSIPEIISRQFNDRDNLFLLTIYGLIPFMLHGAFCFWYGVVFSYRVLNCYAVTGLLSILLCMIPMYALTWLPLYGYGKSSSTYVIVLMFIPWFCVLSLGLGLAVSWLITRTRFFR